MDGYSSQGNWKELDISSATAVITKVGDVDWISVSAESIPKTAKITLPKELLGSANISISAASYASLKRGGPCS
jgi:hypothetical protein